MHLHENLKTVEKIGSRRGEALILNIESGKMHEYGFEFYYSENGVWLRDNETLNLLNLKYESSMVKRYHL